MSKADVFAVWRRRRGLVALCATVGAGGRLPGTFILLASINAGIILGGFFMFDNIGGKIKKLAKVCAWIGIIGSILGGLGTFAIGGILGFLFVAGLGCLLSWVGAFGLYGFGQLIENSDKLVAASYKWGRPQA